MQVKMHFDCWNACQHSFFWLLKCMHVNMTWDNLPTEKSTPTCINCISTTKMHVDTRHALYRACQKAFWIVLGEHCHRFLKRFQSRFHRIENCKTRHIVSRNSISFMLKLSMSSNSKRGKFQTDKIWRILCRIRHWKLIYGIHAIYP